MAATSAPRLLTDDELWNTDYVNKQYVSSSRAQFYTMEQQKLTRRHMQAFARALALSDTAPIEGDISPASPRSPSLGLEREGSTRSIHQTWKYGADNGAFGSGHGGPNEKGGRERIEKLTATSDFAVSST